MHNGRIGTYRLFLFLLLVLNTVSLYACTKDDGILVWDEFVRCALPDTVLVTLPIPDWKESSEIIVSEYAPLNITHQSAAVYGDYAFFVTSGRSAIYLFNLRKKALLSTLSLKVQNSSIYHCNQSSFGPDKFEPSDPFPLLYVSQRTRSNQRCFVEVFRILPSYNEVLSDYDSFHVELVQLIYLPAMTSGNSLGNVNCVLDFASRSMYTYSRNNNQADDNYGICKISEFRIPDIYSKQVSLEDDDILSSFMLDISALYMQGGCINDGLLYIGQGDLSYGFTYLNVIDLEKEALLTRIDLQEYGVRWEPEGCFFYDGSVMLSHKGAICRIDR